MSWRNIITKLRGTAKNMKRFTKLGLALTAGWVLAVGFVILFRVGDAIAMRLNEWGDFFAGAAAPLALSWLVIGYFQHSEELRLNTRALETQQEELRRQVEETSRLVEAAREEVQFLQEREQREARPDLISNGRTWSSKDGVSVQFQNRGAEARAVRVHYEGSYKLEFKPGEILGPNDIGTLFVSGMRNQARLYPIPFCIVCADLIGYSHTFMFELHDGGLITKLAHSWENLREKHEMQQILEQEMNNS